MKEPNIGLALGSGGARGFAHIGVLKVLNEANIHVDFVAGSSIGALVGALYGVGHTYESMYKMATTFKRKFYLDFTVPKMGLVSGDKLTALVKMMTHGKTFEQTTPRLHIVATDLISGERIIFKEGYLYEAVRASISIPGIFVPVSMGERMLVDGSVTDRVPVSIVKDMGADFIIAVDVSTFTGGSKISSIFDVIMQSIDIMQQEMTNYQELSADIMLKPKVTQYESMAFRNIKEIISIGEDTARQQLPKIEYLLNKWKEHHSE